MTSQNKTKVSIKNLKSYGSKGWMWDVEVTEPYNKPSKSSYRTNAGGEGLWRCGEYEDKQISGTAQFDLPSSKNAARSKLYRQFNNE